MIQDLTFLGYARFRLGLDFQIIWVPLKVLDSKFHHNWDSCLHDSGNGSLKYTLWSHRISVLLHPNNCTMWSSHLKRRKNQSKIRMTSFLLRRQTVFFLFCFLLCFSVQVLKYCSLLVFLFSSGWLYVCLSILIFCVYPPVLSGWAISHKAPLLA